MKYINIILISAIVYLLLALSARGVSAASVVAEESAKFKSEETVIQDSRVEKLADYLASHKSPLADYAAVFVAEADKYDLDYRLVPAISGVESTFGKRIPGGYNAYGWANGKYAFNSWEESIEIVNKTLKEKYVDRGLTSVDAIGRVYAPPSKTWARNVKFFMQKIDPLPLEFTLEG